MKLLLTSAGVQNPTIEGALVDLLGKPIAESSALCIPTAEYAHPLAGAAGAWRFVSGRSPLHMTDLGWQSIGLLELTALPSLGDELWTPLLDGADALLVAGGDSLFLAHWLRESGLADRFPTLTETVYVGLSGGGMALTPRIGADFVSWVPPGGGDAALGLVDFSIFPHLDHPKLPDNSMAGAEQWAASLGGPAYAIDDETAIRVVDGQADVVTEGHWRHFPA